MPTTADVIEIAKVCVSLATKAIELQQENDINLPKKISTEAYLLEWVNENNYTGIDIDGYTNYVYGMCGGYAYEAEGLIGTGGIVVNPASGGATGRMPLAFGKFASSGSTSVVFSEAIDKLILSITRASFDTGEIIFSGTPTGNQVKWDTNTGTVTVFTPFTTGEYVKIIVY